MYNLPKWNKPAVLRRGCFFCSLFLLANCSPIDAQNHSFCQTAPSSHSAIGALPVKTGEADPPGPFFVRVYLHALGDAEGCDMPAFEQISETFELLKSAFHEHNIFFIWDCSVAEIRSAPLYNWNNLSGLCGLEKWFEPHPDGIDIIIGGDAAPAYAAAGGIPGKTILIKGKELVGPPGNQVAYAPARSLIAAHEMGHCLGLWHTFHGAEGARDCAGVLVDPTECKELANGSNAATCGDYVADTPAEPYPPFNPHSAYLSDCFYYYNTLDPNGQPYQPNTHLIMSYTYVGCMTHLTAGQGIRMRQLLSTAPVLMACTIDPDMLNVNVSGAMSWTAANTPNQGEFYLQGDLTVRSGGSLTIGPDVRIHFGQNSRLVIEPNAVLYLHGTLSSMACSNTWRGIEVWGGGPDKSQFPASGAYAQGRLFIGAGALIENAKTAVRLFGPTKAQAGGQISGQGGSFRNNVIGVDFAPFQNPAAGPGAGPLDYAAAFERCQFFNDEQYPHAEPFFAFMRMSGVVGVQIAGTRFRNEQPARGHSIADRGYGILAVDAGFNVRESAAAGKPLAFSRFEGLGYAIQAQRNLNNRPYSVAKCYFNRCFVGIRNWGVSGANVLFNTFQLGKLPAEGLIADQIGLLLESEAAGFNVAENEFLGSGDNPEITTIGLVCLNTGEMNKRIRRNRYVDLNIGNLANQINGAIFRPNQPEPLARGLLFECNEHWTTELDQSFDLSTPNGQVRNRQGLELLRGAETAGYLAAGNQFSAGGNPWANSGAPLVYFFNPTGPDQTPAGAQGAFVAQPVSGAVCPAGALLPADLPADVLQQMKNGFFELQAAAVAASQAIGPAPDPGQRAALAYYRRLLDEHAFQIAGHYQAAVDGAQPDSLLAWVGRMNSLEGELWRAQLFLAKGALAEAIGVVDGMFAKFPLTSDLQADLRNYKKICQLVAGKNIFQLDAASLQALYPYTQGAAGYSRSWARRLLTPHSWHFAPEYVRFGPEMRSETVALPDVPPCPAPFPNPANTMATFSLPENPTGEPARLELADAAGRLISAIEIPLSAAGQYPWPAGQYPVGLYFYRLTVGGQQCSGKLAVQR